MRYRVDDLAARAGMSVDTIRYYQSQGLLPAPQREGRTAWYSQDHLDRLARIRSFKSQGFTLASIRKLLDGDLDPADRALAEALQGALPGDGPEADGGFLTVEELARRTGISPALLEAIERDGLLVPRTEGGETRYTEADARAIASGLALLEAGLPLSELLALARDHHEAMQKVASRAVDLFVRFVRDPIRAGSTDEDEAADKMVAAFGKMFPATSSLIAHHFRRVLLAEATARLERDGLPSEIDAVKQDAGAQGSSWPA